MRKIGAVIEDALADEIKDALERWRERFDRETWSIRLEQVAGGYQLATRPDYAVYISRMYQGRRKFRFSRAALETLAIIAYRQPVTRAEIENVRGVGCGGVVANLMERSLIKITGKAKILGAPFLYGTTSDFLEYLGLNSLGDLPSMAELESLLEKEAYPEEAAADTMEQSGVEAPADDGKPGGDGLSRADADIADAVAAMDSATRAAAETAGTPPKPSRGQQDEAGETMAGAASVLGSENEEEGDIDAGELGGSDDSGIPTVEFERNSIDESASGDGEEPKDDDDDR